MRYFSIPVSLALAFVLVVVTFLYLVGGVAALEAPASAGVILGALFLSITLASLFVPIGEVALLAPFVLVIRGPQAIGRVPPSRCNSLFSWLFYEWNFWGKGCRQEGLRVLGLEVAVQGSLH